MVIFYLQAKQCMQKLLLTETFDSFSFLEGDVASFCTFHIDGKLHKDFFEEAPAEEYTDWGQVKERFLAVIKGKKTPLSFRFILSLSPSDLPAFLHENDLAFRFEEIQGLYLNIRFDEGRLSLITGTSLHTFTMDKSVEHTWDLYVERFLTKAGLTFEQG